MKRRKMIGLITGSAGIATGGFLMHPSVSYAGDNKREKTPDEPGNQVSSDQLPPYIVFASQTNARLDSNVITGGGTDDTEIIQAILDKAPDLGNLHLVMDGAALVRGLNIHSNTTIECLNSSCGFFLAPQSNRSVIQNVNLNMSGERVDKNITLLGGTYNQNCKQQEHHITLPGKGEKWVITMEFYGVENFTMRDVTIRNQRTFAMLMANWFRVNMENISIDLPDHEDKSNQDGLHFFGPGQFLTLKNIQGSSGDDFLAIAPDEHDGVSDITDVLIDGVFLNNADQGIRLLSKGKGKLDRVIIKNITGTYRSFGFYIDPWFRNSSGNFGNIVFDTVDLRQSEPNYHYTPPFLFRLGGQIENLTLRNIYHHKPVDNRSIIDIGWPNEDKGHDSCISFINSLLIDGLHVYHPHDEAPDSSLIKVSVPVNNLNIRNVQILKPENSPQNVCLIETRRAGKINTLQLNNIQSNCMQHLVLHKTGEIDKIQLHNIFYTDSDNAMIKMEDGNIRQVFAGEIYNSELISIGGKGEVGQITGYKKKKSSK